MMPHFTFLAECAQPLTSLLIYNIIFLAQILLLYLRFPKVEAVEEIIMFKGVRGKVSLLLVAAALLPLFFLVIAPVWQMVSLPEPYYVELPEFKGRILDGGQVKTGTFTVIERFELTPQWGEDGILVYDSVIQGLPVSKRPNALRFRAWKPDPKSFGIFSYAKKEIPVPNTWGCYQGIGNIEREGQRLKVSPDFFGSPLIIIGTLLVALLLLIAWVVNPCFPYQ